jgi:hypothetical protein
MILALFFLKKEKKGATLLRFQEKTSDTFEVTGLRPMTAEGRCHTANS